MFVQAYFGNANNVVILYCLRLSTSPAERVALAESAMRRAWQVRPQAPGSIAAHDRRSPALQHQDVKAATQRGASEPRIDLRAMRGDGRA